MINDEETLNEEISEETAEESSEVAETAETEIEEPETAESEADSVARELAEVKDQLLRTMAEYDNFRKRSAKEKTVLRADIIADVTSKFLPVMDNLDRALSAECADESFKKGVQMISDSFNETLKNLGVEEIASDGEQFNPGFHQAVQRVDDSDAESGTVVQTFAKGYKIGDKVIRFAMVAVAN